MLPSERSHEDLSGLSRCQRNVAAAFAAIFCSKAKCLKGLLPMQLGGNVQQAQQQMDQRQEVFNKLQNQLNAENAARDQAARVPIAVPVPPPAYQDGVSC